MVMFRVLSYLALTLGATVLLLIQPWVHSWLQPVFGGGAHLWGAVLVFFQWGVAFAYLLAAYLFAHWDSKKVVALVVMLGGVSCVQLAMMLAPEELGLAENVSFSSVLVWLIASVGGVSLLMASSSLVLQALWDRAGFERPTMLYAWTNLISVGALVLYPVILEPTFSLKTVGWSIALSIVVWCFAVAMMWMVGPRELRTTPTPFPSPAATRYGAWSIVGFIATAMMTAAARDVTMDTSGVPFIGLMPLVVYLLAIAIAFADLFMLSHWVKGALSTIACVWMIEVLKVAGQATLFEELSAYCGMVGILTYTLVAELKPARIRSDVLLWHYVALAVGGALGGTCVSLVAPELWNSAIEFQASVLLGIVWLAYRSQSSLSREVESSRLRFRTGLVWFGALVFWTTGSGQLFLKDHEQHRWQNRSFLGRIAVEEATLTLHGERHLLNVLVHGRTFHGGVLSDTAATLYPEPLTYYASGSGFYQGLQAVFSSQKGNPVSAAGIGLGIGAATAAFRPGDTLQFWELDPLVTEAAESSMFGQLSRMRKQGVTIDVDNVDGRMGVRSWDLNRGRFDYLILDAFSSDSIPTHLLTVEAFDEYDRIVTETALIAVHVSNRHIDLVPVLAGVAVSKGYKFGYVYQDAQSENGIFASSWVLLWKSSELDGLLSAQGVQAIEHKDLAVEYWHDLKKDLWSVIRW